MKKNFTAEYIKIRRYVMNRIHRAGTETVLLPTAQELAIRFGVSRQTVCKAMKALTEEGYVIGRPGIGSFTNPNRGGMGKSSMSGQKVIGILIGDGMVMHYEIYFGEYLSQLLHKVINYPALMHILNLSSNDPEKNANEIMAEDLDGLFWVTPPPFCKATIQKIQSNGLPVVTIGEENFCNNNIIADTTVLGREIAEILIRKNRRRVVFLANEYPWNTPLKSMLKTYQDAGIKLNEKLFLSGTEESLDRLKDLLEVGAPVDTVVNPFFSFDQVIRLFNSIDPELLKNCTFVNNTLHVGKQRFPDEIRYEYPITDCVEAASRRMQELLQGPTAAQKTEFIHIPVR